jgi:hypothetical protein
VAVAASAAVAAGVTEVAEKDLRIGAALAAATCSLLGTAAPGYRSPPMPKPDGTLIPRFSTTARAMARQRPEPERARHARLRRRTQARTRSERGFANRRSPSGAIATGRPQTFTSPSGRDTYTTPAGEIPLDTSFLDTRFALNGSWSQPFARLYTMNAGLGFSSEYDYQHIGADFGVTRDFNLRNTTLSAALAYAQDTIKPVGGLPLPSRR